MTLAELAPWLGVDSPKEARSLVRDIARSHPAIVSPASSSRRLVIDMRELRRAEPDLFVDLADVCLSVKLDVLEEQLAKLRRSLQTIDAQAAANGRALETYSRRQPTSSPNRQRGRSSRSRSSVSPTSRSFKSATAREKASSQISGVSVPAAACARSSATISSTPER